MQFSSRRMVVKLQHRAILLQTNLSNFNGTTYRNISRSYFEFSSFTRHHPQHSQTIVPALPLPQTSAATDEEDDRLVKLMLQRWLTRICEDPILLHDEEVRSFVESDFGISRLQSFEETSSGFSLIKRSVPMRTKRYKVSLRTDETRGQFFDAARTLDKLSRTRRACIIIHCRFCIF